MRDFIALPDQPSWMFLNVSAVSTAAAEWVNERRSNSKEKPKVHQEKRETIHSTDLPPRVAKARLACAASAPVKAKRAHFIVSRTTFPHLRKEVHTRYHGFRYHCKFSRPYPDRITHQPTDATAANGPVRHHPASSCSKVASARLSKRFRVRVRFSRITPRSVSPGKATPLPMKNY